MPRVALGISGCIGTYARSRDVGSAAIKTIVLAIVRSNASLCHLSDRLDRRSAIILDLAIIPHTTGNEKCLLVIG